jgi:hypothetical protein
LVCPESAVKKDLEEYLTADNSRITTDKIEYFSPIDPAEVEVGLRK